MEIIMMSWCELGYLPPPGWYAGDNFQSQTEAFQLQNSNNNNNNNE